MKMDITIEEKTMADKFYDNSPPDPVQKDATPPPVESTDKPPEVIPPVEKPVDKVEPVKEEPTEPVIESPKLEDKKVPDKYDLKLPEKTLLAPERLQGVAEYSKKHGLSQEAAQGLVDRENEAVMSYAKAYEDSVNENIDSWESKTKADKEIGGVHFAENIGHAKRALESFGSQELKQALSQTGLGNHPELIRMFSKIGRQMAPDKLVAPGSVSPGGRQGIAELFYDNTK
jgi:hypothetical protein